MGCNAGSGEIQPSNLERRAIQQSTVAGRAKQDKFCS
jgi:hypothetical protein